MRFKSQVLPSQRFSGKREAYNPMLGEQSCDPSEVVPSAPSSSPRGFAEGVLYPSPLDLKSSFVWNFLFLEQL